MSDTLYSVVRKTAKPGDAATDACGDPAQIGHTINSVPAFLNFTARETLAAVANLDIDPTPWAVATVEYRADGWYAITKILEEPYNLTAAIGPQAEQLQQLALIWPFIDRDLHPTYKPEERSATEAFTYRAARRNASEALDAASAEAFTDSPLEWAWDILETDRGGGEFQALAARHLIDPATPWDQDAYDAMTREYRLHVGQLHPDDTDLTQPALTV